MGVVQFECVGVVGGWGGGLMEVYVVEGLGIGYVVYAYEVLFGFDVGDVELEGFVGVVSVGDYLVCFVLDFEG